MLDCTRKNWWLRGISGQLWKAGVRGGSRRTAGTRGRRRVAGSSGKAVSGESLEVRTLLTTITIDYSLDTNNFFDSQEKMDLLQSAADSLASRLTDSLAAIEPGPSGFGFDNTWTADFNHPGTGSPQMITDLTIPADTLIVYAGGRDLAGSTVGFGGPGGYSSSGTQAFLDLVASRGQSGALDSPATDFGPWGGAITFDTETNWFFGTTTSGLDSDETDFFSVAEHELAHLLGLGTAESWDTYVSGSSFTGTASVAEYGGNVPLNGDASHWASDTMSDGRDATMTPTLLNGTRGLFTSLDYAALDDIGWDVAAPVDYGDAPDTGAGTGAGNYQTLASDNGPSHTIVAGLFLGDTVDGNTGSLQNTAATADDFDGSDPDDEDGIQSERLLRATVGTVPVIKLFATNTTGSQAILSGWIDYNSDGVFDNATERAQVVVPSGAAPGLFTLTFPAISDRLPGQTYARFRLSTDSAGQDATGPASDGEVEDYGFSIISEDAGLVDHSVLIGSSTNGGPVLTNAYRFGTSVANLGDLDGDGVVDLAVGSSRDEGNVHILFMNADGTVKSSTSLQSSVTLDNGDRFGSSVASLGDLDGDGVPELAVGAAGNDINTSLTGRRRGAVYVLFLRSNGTVKSKTKITTGTSGGPGLTYDDYFGASVAAVGDLDGDGVTDLAVGADGDDTGGRLRGAVHILFLNSSGTVKSSTKIASGTNGGPVLPDDGYFGRSLASLGDLDGDGVTDLAVGVPGEDTNGFRDRGAVQVLFLNSDGSVKSSAKIATEGDEVLPLADGDLFGSSIASLGDVNGDGVVDLAVGAAGDATEGFPTYGAVHILLLAPDGSATSSKKIVSGAGGGPTRYSAYSFGASVASLGDLNNDGIVDMAVGATGDDTGGSGRGAVQVLFLDLPVGPRDESVTLPAGGSYEVLRDGDDLVTRVSGGAELLRQPAALVASLTVNGSADADLVTVLDAGTAVEMPLVFVGGDGDDAFDASLATGPVNLSGNSGSDTLIGGSGDDTLVGGSQADELVGGGGNDLVNGAGGTGDTLEGGDGDDTLNGGGGNDLIRETFAGDATLTNSAMTGRGNDTVISAERAFLSGGGSGQTFDVGAFFTEGLTSVTLNGAGGNDVLIGSSGSDVLIGGGGRDSLDGGAGNDRILGGSGADTLSGGAGNDLLKGLGGSGDLLSGGEGDDTLNGGRGIDRLVETADTDFTLTNSALTGLGSDVVQAIEIAELNGGESANTIDVSAFLGFRGFSLIRGNAGDDTVFGSIGVDVINGGDGNDSLVGNEGNDLLNGDAGDDILLGKQGNDTLNGGDGNDGLSGFTGDDEINGERGYDIGLGGEGNDTLTGGNAIDTLIGGNGNDSITGDGGNDTLVGGTGNNDASPGDVISDTTANIDEAFSLAPLPAWVDQV